MKKLFLPVIAVATLFACSDDDSPAVVSPLEITKADYMTNYAVNGTPFSFYAVNPSDVTIPVAGIDQTWDFSGLDETSTSNNGGSAFMAPSNSAYPSATYGYTGSSSWFVGAAESGEFPSTAFVEVSDDGVFDLGFTQETEVSIPVPALGAVISFPTQNLTYSGGKYPTVLFPAKMGDAPITTSGLVINNNFIANAPALGLNNTPGQSRGTTSITQTVIASGTATLKGIGAKRVLVLKSDFIETTNYFLGGAPAPAALLTNLGIQDGTSVTYTTYRVLAEGLGTVGFVNVNANGEITSASFRKG
uniref:hypothetical protein n=1 Tax=Flavobacterium sp. TaxID=239 RepID=UPI00404B0BD3